MSKPTAISHYLEDKLEDRAGIFRPGDGTQISIKGGRITLKVTSDRTNDQLGVYEISLEAGVVGAGLHFHRFMDETFIITEGTVTVQHGDKETPAPAGSVIHVPRFTPHGFANKSDSRATLMLIFNPAQSREGFFYGIAEILNADKINQEDFLKLYARYDSYPVKPA